MTADKHIVFCELDGAVIMDKEIFKMIMDFYLAGHPNERIHVKESKAFRADIALLFAEPKGIA